MKNEKTSIVSFAELLKELQPFIATEALSISKVFKFFEAEEGWRRLPGWEDMSDRHIYQCIAGGAALAGTVYIVTDVSYRPGLGVFAVNAQDFSDFIDGYLLAYGECLINGDTLIFCPESKMMVMFHHEGVFLSRQF